MKTATDPRHLKRIAVLQDLFAWQFNTTCVQKTKDLTQIIKNIADLDNIIQSAAPEWPLNQINKIDLAILRLSIYELIIKKDAPMKVTVDEAVELAKQFGAESSPGFINGVLGKVISLKRLK